MRKINFGSGPAALPEEVLKEASEAVIGYSNSGLSILELPHRGNYFEAILEESISLVNELCGLDNNYEILWLQGGRLQFSMIPLNFLPNDKKAGYIDSGHWAAEAATYAAFHGDVEIIASSKQTNYNQLPTLHHPINSELAYLYLTTNNTIYGTQWKQLPTVSMPLIADMSSDILGVERTYHQCALFYAVAQKNIGPAGVTLVAIHKDFIKKSLPNSSPILDYKMHAKNRSVLNTPPVFAIYTSLLTLRWIKKVGLSSLLQQNEKKATTLYNEIDRNTLFEGTVVTKSDRSKMNVCFTMKQAELETQFLQLCTSQNIEGIAGHRSVGGFRASLYNAVSLNDVEKLVSLMQEFEQSKIQ